jgi:hypothetical protein
MPTYADFGGWVISTFAGWFVVTADNPKSDEQKTLISGRLFCQRPLPFLLPRCKQEICVR